MNGCSSVKMEHGRNVVGIVSYVSLNWILVDGTMICCMYIHTHYLDPMHLMDVCM